MDIRSPKLRFSSSFDLMMYYAAGYEGGKDQMGVCVRYMPDGRIQKETRPHMACRWLCHFRSKVSTHVKAAAVKVITFTVSLSSLLRKIAQTGHPANDFDKSVLAFQH